MPPCILSDVKPLLPECWFGVPLHKTGFTPDAVALAVSRMEQNIGKFSLNYLKKIQLLDEKGVHTVSELLPSN